MTNDLFFCSFRAIQHSFACANSLLALAERSLRPLAVVDVEVDDENAIRRVSAVQQSVLGGQGDIVQQAETVGLVSEGVMARWAHECKRIRNLNAE